MLPLDSSLAKVGSYKRAFTSDIAVLIKQTEVYIERSE